MSLIARYTTPSITYKPSLVEIAEVDKIFLVVKQNGQEVIRKDIDDAITDENGFTWYLEQEDTALLDTRVSAVVKIDYLSGTARFTTEPKTYNVTNSGIEEVIR